jgi:hypothetical protein
MEPDKELQKPQNTEITQASDYEDVINILRDASNRLAALHTPEAQQQQRQEAAND